MYNLIFMYFLAVFCIWCYRTQPPIIDMHVPQGVIRTSMFNRRDMGSSQRDAERTLAATGLKPKGEYPTSLRLQLPYLQMEMFEVQGMRKTPCYLMRIMEMVDSYKPPRTKDPDEITMSYISRYTLEVDPSIYTSKTFNYPLVLEHSVDYVKRTSRRTTIQLKETGRSCPLATLSWINVNVDLETKQLKPFPDWWKQKYNLPSDGPTIDIQVPEKPTSDVCVDETVVRFTDIDSNNHTNYISYVKMCLDAFYDGVLRKKYTHGSDVFLNGWLKSLSIVFQSDSVWGDTLKIESWQDTQHYDKFYFEVINKGKVSVILAMQFYTSLADKSRL